MKAEVLALIEELKRLRKQGVDHVNVSDASIQKLRNRMIAATVDPSTRDEVLESIPEKVRSANASDFDKIIVESKTPEGRAAASGKRLASKLPKPPKVSLPDGDKQTRWNALREQALHCAVCEAQAGPEKKLVFGTGNLEADVFFCGDAPGPDEESEGEPFVGDAGQLLNKMIMAMGLRREQVYLANIVTWRPQAPTAGGVRPPTEEEMKFCLPYLKAQVEIVQPKLIVALGASAAKGLLGADAFRNLREVKGKWQDFEGTPVMPTYHPSYLLRNNTNRDKRAAWEDWLLIVEKAGLPISDKQRGYFL